MSSPPIDGSFKNIDHFIEQMDSVIKRNSPLDEKINQFSTIIENNDNFLKTYQNPNVAGRFEKLAQRISTIAVESADQKARIEKVSQDLRDYAQNFRLPNELMNLIVRDFTQSKTTPKVVGILRQTSNLRQTSKETRKQVAEAFRGKLIKLDIQTADQVIQFAKKYGPGLTYFNISKIPFSKEQLRELIQFLPKLNTFLASNCKIDQEGAEVIAHSQNLSTLQTLNLTCNNLSDGGAKAIATSPTLKNLLSLILIENKIGQVGTEAIAHSQNLSKLQELDLSCNNPGEAGAKAIAASETLSNLKSLIVRFSSLGPAAAKAIAESKTLKNLEELDLWGTGIEEAGAIAIASSQTLSKLQILNISSNRIGPGGAKAIAESKTLTKLQQLNVIYSNIGDDGAKALAASPTLSKVKLGIFGNKIGMTGEYALSKRESLSHLNESQWQELYQTVCKLAKIDGYQIDVEDEDWGKQHLFDNEFNFERAFSIVTQQL